MKKHKLLIAVLSGSAVASMFVLLLNVPVQIIAMVAFLFLLPGGALATVVYRSSEFIPPLAVLAANALVYSLIVFIVLIAPVSRGVTAATVRLLAIRLAIPALLLIGFACVPAFNPLWPHGMAELMKQERELQETLPMGMGLDQARAVLQSKGIQFQESTEETQTVVFEREGKSVTAGRGDSVIWTRLETEASQFPCGYQIQILLVFGQDKRMKQQDIQRFPICP
jgi:hypothetical protein